MSATMTSMQKKIAIFATIVVGMVALVVLAIVVWVVIWPPIAALLRG